MDRKTTTFDKRNFYNDKDSGMVFLFALILPILLSLVFSLIANVIVAAGGYEDSTEVTNSIWVTAILSVVSAISYVVLYLVYNKINKIEYNAIKLKFKMKWHTYLIVVAVGVIALFGIQYFIGGVDDLLKLIGFPLQEASPDSPESLANPQSFGIFVLAVFITGLIPAITEELLFRGIILNGLRTRFNDYSAIFLSAFMFALMHQNLQQLVYPFLLGSIMAWLVVRTGSLVSSMIVHFINNFLVILFAYLNITTSFSLNMPNTWWSYLIAILLLAVTFGIMYLIDRYYFKHKSAEMVEKSSTKTSVYIYVSIAIALVLLLFITIFNFVSA